jgi:hypothetical protein
VSVANESTFEDSAAFSPQDANANTLATDNNANTFFIVLLNKVN